VRELYPENSATRRRPVVAGDFNGDGWPDVIRIAANPNESPISAVIWLNSASNDGSGNPQFASSYDMLASGTALSDIGIQTWAGSNLWATDFNGDRKIDVLIGSGYNNGTIRVFLNDCTLASPLPDPLPATGPLPCSNAPHFAYSSTLITNMGFPSGANLPVFAYDDVDGDGLPDLIAGAPSCCSTASDRLRLWKGLAGGGLSATPQSITFDGGATDVLITDFSGDGINDLVVATDNWNYNSGAGGNSFYWTNNGTSTPFSDAPQQLTYNSASTYDFDVGFHFDYDHDPQASQDIMLADGNHTGNFYILANRNLPQYVACGTVTSGVIDLGALAGTEMVVTAARISPTVVLDEGTVTFYLSNEDPANWVEAVDCGDSSGDLCASFPKPVGSDVRWKAELCANTYHTATPTITGIGVSFDYTQSQDNVRAGVIVNDGVAYVGGFRQPGDRGHLFAVDAALTQTYWDLADSLDAMADGSRSIYTSNQTGDTRLDFTTANAADLDLQTTLAVVDGSQAADVISWVRSARFGVGNAGVPQSRLGGIETSTPAILTPPGIPLWYVFGSSADRAKHLTFQTTYADRRKLVLFGSKDAMIHAVQTNPANITTSPSGVEAWAFIPPKVADGLLADYTASLAGTTVATHYPDGSPTLADYRKSNGDFATAAVVSSGNGGRGLMALDVTSTVDPSSGTTTGPTPLWTALPGDADAGMGLSKPAVARVLVGSAERYYVIAATGIAPENPTAPWVEGRVVSAYDLATGEHVWDFRAACPVTSDITVFETDDDIEPGAPTFNGFIDRAVFADACGNVYKVDPAKDLGGGWNDNSTMGSYEVEDIGGVKQMALFSTALTTGALGAESPIAGTIAAKSDVTTRLVLYFGTGGLESHDPTQPNEFYAVYADTGKIRSKVTGACPGNCEKFYGGVVITASQLIFTRTVDPVPGSGTCDTGSSIVQGMQLDADGGGDFVEDFSQSLTSAVVSALYGDAGALYFATLGGEVSRIGTPRAATAGTDTAPPVFGTGTDSGQAGVGSINPLTLLGWRQVL